MKCIFHVLCDNFVEEFTSYFYPNEYWEEKFAKEHFEDDDKLEECLQSLKECGWYGIDDGHDDYFAPKGDFPDGNLSDKQVIAYINYCEMSSICYVYPKDQWEVLFKEELMKNWDCDENYANFVLEELVQTGDVYGGIGECSVLIKGN